jgi:hypothetical protein
MIDRLKALDRFFGSERGQKAVAVVAGVLLITAAASVGANKSDDAAGITGDSDSSVVGTGSIDELDSADGLPGGKSAGAGSTGTISAPGSVGPQLTKEQLRALDFGLVTQGVTDKEVKVGFSGNFDNCGDTAGLAQQFGPLIGNPEKSINTFARYVNEHGGVGGRAYKPIIVQDGGSGCPERNLPAAVEMAQEHKVFLAAPGLHVESDYIIDHKIPVWGGRDDPASLAKYGANGFALFQPIEPTLAAWSSFGKHYLKTTDKTGPKKACLIRIETGASGNWDIPEKILVEKMKAYNIRFVDIYVFKDDASTAQAQSDAIARREKDLGCEHVYFMAGNPVGLIFITSAATQNQWFPETWTFTSYTALTDDDNIAKAMDQAQWENAKGLTYRIPDGEHPKGDNCKNIYESYNGNDGTSESASVLLACSAILTTSDAMNRGIKLTGRLDANSLVIGFNAIQNDFYFDAHVPMQFVVPDPDGPFKTRGFSHWTVADWSSAESKYTFPKYPCYYRTFGPNNAGCDDLRSLYKK